MGRDKAEKVSRLDRAPYHQIDSLQSGGVLLYTLMATAFLGIVLVGYHTFVTNNLKETRLSRLKIGRELAFRNLMAMASSTNALYVSSRLPGPNNQMLRNCINVGSGTCTADGNYRLFRLYTPFRPNANPIVASSASVSGGDRRGRYTVNGFPSTSCQNATACAFYGHVYFRAECANGAPTCDQASRIFVRPRVNFKLDPPEQFPDWMRAISGGSGSVIGSLPSDAALAQEPSRFEKAVYAKDIEENDNFCPPFAAVAGVDVVGRVTCACKTGFSNANGSLTNPQCVSMRRCPDKQVLIGINDDGTPKCFVPKVTEYTTWYITNGGPNNVYDCGATGRMKGADFSQQDCTVDDQGLVHCDHAVITCARPM